MPTLVLGSLLLIVLAFFSRSVRSRLQGRLHARPGLVFVAPAALGGFFCLIAAQAHALSLPLALLVAAYTFVPAGLAFAQGPGYIKRPTWRDFAVILMLWLPLEFAAGQNLIPKPVQGFLHSVAYGIAILLALVLFTGFRSLQGMKYNLPSGFRDFSYAVIGFLVTAPILIFLGLLLGFISPFHIPANFSVWKVAVQFSLIFVATALPEEILFRSLIQNWLMLRYGFTTKMLVLAGFIFGCAHLDNGPQPLPNWRYMILATIAGVAYGKVFQQSSSVVASSVFHALVDVAKHAFF